MYTVYIFFLTKNLDLSCSINSSILQLYTIHLPSNNPISSSSISSNVIFRDVHPANVDDKHKELLLEVVRVRPGPDAWDGNPPCTQVRNGYLGEVWQFSVANHRLRNLVIQRVTGLHKINVGYVTDNSSFIKISWIPYQFSWISPLNWSSKLKVY